MPALELVNLSALTQSQSKTTSTDESKQQPGVAKFPCALLTHIVKNQLAFVEHDVPLEWRVISAQPGRSFHDCLPDALRRLRKPRMASTCVDNASLESVSNTCLTESN